MTGNMVVDIVLDKWPILLAMTTLIGCSAFFSASEAALFSLRPRDRRTLRAGNQSQRAAEFLLKDPERLLTAILFWNLAINVIYFVTASIAGLHLERKQQVSETGALLFTFIALMSLIVLSEMLPKSLGVVSARSLTRLVGLPLSVAVRIVDPLMPILQMTNLLSRRLLWPRFQPEQYLEVVDLERAINLSTTDAQLLEQEQTVLQNIVALSDMRVDETMRPRLQFRSFTPPVHLKDLEGKLPPSGYLLITDFDSDAVAKAINLSGLSEVPEFHLERLAESVIYVPWFHTVADTLEQMVTRDRNVAAVVNEFGDAIGILTFDDILDTIFRLDPTRSARLLNRQAIHEIEPGTWNVTGMTSLRRLARHFNTELPESNSVTLSGVTQEVLERLPETGDEFTWGPFHFRVLDSPEPGVMTLELKRQKKD